MKLLEREHCLANLQAWQRSVADRGGCVVLVAGEAGVGKTSLLQTFSRQNPQIRVLWGACDALYTPRPLAPLHDIARQVSGTLAAAVTAGASRDVTFPAALDELDRPNTLMVFEDIHWADEALGLMHDGLRNAAIAKRLYLSARTVDHHVSSILGKLGAKSRTDAIDIARRSRESAP